MLIYARLPGAEGGEARGVGAFLVRRDDAGVSVARP